MAFFIKTTSRTTFSKYLIEANTAEEAAKADGEYIGVVDEDDDLEPTLSEVFATKEEALLSDEAYTQWS